MKRASVVLLLAFAVVGSGVPASADTVVAALMVSVAAAPMADLIPAYERTHPGVHIQATFGGAPNVVAQLAAGATPDLLVGGPATFAPMSGKVSTPVTLFSVHEAVIVPKGSTKVRSLRDLASPGVRVVMGSAGSPQAHFAHTLLDKSSALYGADFERKVMANVVTTRSAESQIISSLKNGAADAAIGFTSDASDSLIALPVPPAGDTVTTFSIAILSGSQHGAAAQAFIDYLRGADGQAILRKYHFDATR